MCLDIRKALVAIGQPKTADLVILTYKTCVVYRQRMLIGQVLRACSFLAVERLVRSSARQALAVSRSFSDDALDYFTERLDLAVTRVALASVLHQAKRNKAFENSGGIGVAVDGSTVGWSTGWSLRCLCRRGWGIRHRSFPPCGWPAGLARGGSLESQLARTVGSGAKAISFSTSQTHLLLRRRSR